MLRLVRKLGRRRHRQEEGKILVEGRRLVWEAAAAGMAPEAVLFTPEFASRPEGKELLERLANRGVRFGQISDAELRELAETEHPQGVLAVVPWQQAEPAELLAGSDQLLVIAEQIRDPGNLGAILRTADAAAVSGVLCTAGTVDPSNPKVLRAGMGAAFHLPIASLAGGTAEWAALLRDNGVRLVATAPGGSFSPEDVDLQGKCALIFGNEGDGLHPAVLAAADCVVGIPMPGRAESLNVAAAAAILLYAAVRQRQVQV